MTEGHPLPRRRARSQAPRRAPGGVHAREHGDHGRKGKEGATQPISRRSLKLPRFGGHLNIVRRRCPPKRDNFSHDEGGELAATKALLDDVNVQGCLITLDALHTTHDTERAIVDIHRADYLFTVKGNGSDTAAALAALDWNAPGVRHHRAAPEKGHGRVERRQLDARTLPERVLSFDKARQAMRIVRERTELRTGETTAETAYAITSVSAERADPEQLLAWNRGIAWWKTPTIIGATRTSARTPAAAASSARSITAPKPLAPTLYWYPSTCRTELSASASSRGASRTPARAERTGRTGGGRARSLRSHRASHTGEEGVAARRTLLSAAGAAGGGRPSHRALFRVALSGPANHPTGE